MKITRALLSALALLALLAVPAFAQTGSFTVTIDCGNPESITVENNTDEALVLETLNSSENQTSENEIDLDDAEVAAGESETIPFGSEGGGGNIFNNDLTETATVTISGKDYELTCEMGGTATETFQIGVATPEPTAVVEATAEPANTPTVEETAEPVVDPTVDDAQDEDEQTEDEQSEDMPEDMPETGMGGLATGLPPGGALAGASLLAAAYAGLRRR